MTYNDYIALIDKTIESNPTDKTLFELENRINNDENLTGSEMGQLMMYGIELYRNKYAI